MDMPMKKKRALASQAAARGPLPELPKELLDELVRGGDDAGRGAAAQVVAAGVVGAGVLFVVEGRLFSMTITGAYTTIASNSEVLLSRAVLSFTRALNAGGQSNQSVPKNWGHIWGHGRVLEFWESFLIKEVLDEFHSCSRPKSGGYAIFCVTPCSFIASCNRCVTGFGRCKSI
ncbi:hypothetical protein LMG19087_02901 [Ralstonia wenshanensis]|nr:hypothetical protein [Ralstonia wenshanensis]CAJ0816862.1 hypothetical protein LMG19087_02901 [Ralstonia wenshanensis]